MPDKKSHVSAWKEFWTSLDYGPKGSLIALIIAFLVIAGPTILRLFIYILILVLAMALGGLIGAIIGWIIENYKNRKKK